VLFRSLIYKGQRVDAQDVPVYVEKDLLRPTEKPFLTVAVADFAYEGTTYFAKGDTVQIHPENTYHEIQYTHRETGKQFTLYPRSQVNPNMGLIASPDIRRTLSKDLYTHVSAIPPTAEEKEWAEMEEMEVRMGEQFFANDYVAKLLKIERIDQIEGVELNEGDLAVEAHIQVMGGVEEYTLKPIYLIRDRMVGRIPDTSHELGLRFTLLNIVPDENKFVLGMETTQKEYIVLKAIEKPLINVLWIGTLLLMFGFGVATYRRYQDYRKPAKKAASPPKPQKPKGKPVSV